MTDQELLEFAAKASRQYQGQWSDKVGALRVRSGNTWIEWNPLKSNTDAFRLLVELNLTLTHGWVNDDEEPLALVHVTNQEGTLSAGQIKYGKPHQAARRAITRVAAMIGKEME
jgi:hypothetical protein